MCVIICKNDPISEMPLQNSYMLRIISRETKNQKMTPHWPACSGMNVTVSDVIRYFDCRQVIILYGNLTGNITFITIRHGKAIY